MTSLAKSLLAAVSSINTATFLMACCVASTASGLILITGRETTFIALDFVRLPDWARGQGASSVEHTWWLFSLVGGALAMGISACACTYPRLIQLTRCRRASLAFSMKSSIHGMHIAFIVMVMGYGVSYTMSTIEPALVLVPGGPWAKAPGGLEVRLAGLEKIPYTGPVHEMEGRIVDVKASVALKKGTRCFSREIGLNEALHVEGTIFAIRDFARSGKTGWVMLYVRQDPGAPMIHAGAILLAISAVSYGIATGLSKGKGARST